MWAHDMVGLLPEGRGGGQSGVSAHLIQSTAFQIPLADESVHCVVTSPPYWGLRAYTGDAGMIGLEATFDEHLANLVAVFREVRRVLRKDGTVWLNYGDAYTSGNRATYRSGASDNKGHQVQDDQPRPLTPDGLKPKDLMMMPARVAMALQADGWWLRSEVVWHKPNPMPESCRDRPSSAHEKLFLLGKSARYFYDAAAVRQTPASGPSDLKKMAEGKDRIGGKHKTLNDPFSKASSATNIGRKRSVGHPSGANLRNVWKIATQAYSGAHFATFPEKLIEPCILAGTSEKGVCSECGAQWNRVTENPRHYGELEMAGTGSTRNNLGGQKEWNEYVRPKTTGWSPTCDCDAGPEPAVVLDPFAGSGTTVAVADRFSRIGIGCDIAYQELARKRIQGTVRMLPGIMVTE